MAISQDTAYNFGQLGSVYTDGGSEEINPPTGKVFIAITMLEDTVFDASGGLVAETKTNAGVTNSVYIGTEAAAHDLAAGAETIHEGTGGKVVDGITFPKGMTIYGRWTEIDINSGNIIAYIGE